MKPFNATIMAIDKVVPKEDQIAFAAFYYNGLEARIRTTYLTWSMNGTVKQKAIEKAERERVARPPAPIPVGKGKASDWRDVAAGSKSVR